MSETSAGLSVEPFSLSLTHTLLICFVSFNGTSVDRPMQHGGSPCFLGWSLFKIIAILNGNNL